MPQPLDELIEQVEFENGIKLNDKALNEAKWAACNTEYLEEGVPSMGDASEAAIRSVIAYLVSEKQQEEAQNSIR